MHRYEISAGQVTVSTDPSRLEVEVVHQYLCNQSHWAKGRSFDTVQQSINNSLCFGVYSQGAQIGFARVVSDYTVFATLLDVFILDDYQGQGTGKLLLQTIMEHPDLQEIPVWTLATKDAHGLYRKYGFSELANPSLWMQIDKRNHD